MAALLGCSKLQAAVTRTWSGGGTDFLWSTTANWSGAVANGDNLTFAGATRANTPGPDNTTITSVGNIIFSAGAGAFTINGSAFTLTSGATITNKSTTLQTIQNSITLAGNSTWTETTTGGLTFSGNVNLTNSAATHTLTVSGGAVNSITGIIANGGAGAGSLTASGTGTLTLSGANTYTGTTTLTAGTIDINNATALGTGTFIVNAGTIDNTSAGAITLTNNNAQTWGGNFAFTGTQNLNLGTGAVTLSATRTVTVNGGDLTVGGIISGAGFGVTKAGTGTLTLSGTNTYTGTTTLTAGTLDINNATALGTGTFIVNGGTIDNTSAGAITLTNNNAQTWGGNFAFTGTQNLNLGTGAVTLSPTANITLTTTDAAGNLIVGGAISDSGFGLTKAGAGKLTLNGVNTYTGGTTISAGTLQVDGSGSLGAGTYNGTITDNGTLQYSSSANQTFSGAINGAGGLTKDTSASSILTLSGTNGFTGGLNLTAGTVQVTADTNLGGAANNLTFNGGTLEAAGNVTTSRTLTINSVAGNALKVDTGFTLALSGQFAGAGTLTANGPGTLTLNANQTTFTGILTIASGTVKLGVAQTGFSEIDLAGGTLDLNNLNLTVGNLHITANSTIDFGGSISTKTILDITNLFTIDSGVTLTVQSWNDEVDYFTAANFSGATPNTAGGSPEDQVHFTGFSGGNGATTKWLSLDNEVTPVPEPATYGALFTAAALGLFFWFRLKANTPRLVPERIAVRY